MRKMICLLLACLLFPLLVPAAEALPQPDAGDWNTLLTTAANTRQQYTAIATDVTNNLKNLKSALKNRKPEQAGELKVDIANSENLLARCNKAVAELNAAITELKGMKAADRTRGKYLPLRRKVKIWQVQLETDQRLRYDTGYYTAGFKSRSMFMSPNIEARLQALKENPPESIPIRPRPQGLALDWNTLPRLDGSTTAQPLMALITCRMLGLGAVWQYRPIYDRASSAESPERILIPQCAGSPLPSDANVHSYYGMGGAMFPGLQLNLAMTGTNNAYQNLIYGAADFIIVARPPSEDERKLAKQKGVDLDCRAIGSDAFIFILNSQNPVNTLTVKQVQQIYQDNVLRWSEVGGNNDKLTAFQRERNSGSQETMQELVMKSLTMAPPLEQLMGTGMGGPYNRLNGERNGISYTFYYYHTVQSPVNRFRMANPGGDKPAPPVKVCAVNGIMPTPETIRNRAYPFVTEVYAIVRKDTAQDSAAVRLRDWLLTPEGQALVQESGYVPLPEK
ncbi:MAG: PstS family phosphate ABC transporter substrate-binding protein [Armatimonadota bacterium]